MPKKSKKRAKQAKRRAERRASARKDAPAPTNKDELLARIRREAQLRHRGRARQVREEGLRLERRPDDGG